MVQRKTIRARHGHDDNTIRRALLTGVVYRHDADGHRLAIPTEDELRVAWKKLGGELTAEHVAKSPGTRPWGWWAFTDGALLLDHPWPLHVQHGAVRSRDRNEPGDLPQRLLLQIAGELSADELAELEVIDDPQAEWNHLHQPSDEEPT